MMADLKQFPVRHNRQSAFLQDKALREIRQADIETRSDRGSLIGDQLIRKIVFHTGIDHLVHLGTVQAAQHPVFPAYDAKPQIERFIRKMHFRNAGDVVTERIFIDALAALADAVIVMEYRKSWQKFLFLNHFLQVGKRFIIQPLHGAADRFIIPGDDQRMIHIIRNGGRFFQ